MMIEQWWQDLRLATRGLRRARGFTGASVLTLAVGIAGTTVMFALIQGVLLRPLPVHDQQRLLVAWKELAGAGHWPFEVPDLDVLREESRTLEGVAGVIYNGPLPTAVLENGTASYIRGTSVTGDFFDVLGVDPVLGRALIPADDLTGAEHVLVISHGLWQRRYGGSRDVIGRRLIIQQRPFSIVGVMPPGMDYPRGVEAWMTVAATTSMLTDAAFRVSVDVISRMREGVTLEQAGGELTALVARLDAAAPPGRPRGLTPVARSFEEVVVGDVRAAMLVLFGAVGLVLLIASANVANLLLLRGETRRPELAVRAALGAGRGRLVRQLLAESVMLALAAGMTGLAVTWWTLEALIAFVPDGLPRVDSVRIDAGVVLFTLAIAFVTAALAGLGPALSAAGPDLASHLRSGGRAATGRAVRRGRRALVVAQVALAVTIVAAVGLLTRTLLNLQAVGIGLAADRLVLVPLELPQPKYADRARHLQFLEDVIAELQASPDIASATPVNMEPFSGTGWDAVFTAEGQSAEESEANPLLNMEAIHPNYFATFEVALVRGRAFTNADRESAPNVAIVSEDVAARTWPGEDAIGRRLKIGNIESAEEWRTVVGVARPTRYRELTEPSATLYLPAEQFLVTAQTLVVRTASPVAMVARLAHERVRAVDPDVPVMRVLPLTELLERPLARPRFNAFLIGVFGAAALLLAAIGLYAVMAAFVRQRSREIGVRVALGATPSDVRRLVLGEGLRLAGFGAAIGLATAVGAAPVLRSLLFEVHPLDPVAILAGALLLVAVSALACYFPARAATRMDPIAILRAD